MKFTAAVVFAALAALAYVHLTAPAPLPKTSIPYCPAPKITPEGDFDDVSSFVPCMWARRTADI